MGGPVKKNPIMRLVCHTSSTVESMKEIPVHEPRHSRKEKSSGNNTRGSSSTRAGIAINTAYPLWVGRSVRADIGTIESICRVLECTPGDILILHEREKEETAVNKRGLNLVAA